MGGQKSSDIINGRSLCVLALQDLSQKLKSLEGKCLFIGLVGFLRVCGLGFRGLACLRVCCLGFRVRT